MKSILTQRDFSSQQVIPAVRRPDRKGASLICRFLPDFTILHINAAYCRYLGLSRHQLIGQSIAPYLPAKFWGQMERSLTLLTEDRPVGQLEYYQSQSDGVTHWQHWTCQAFFDASGRPGAYQLTGHGVTRAAREVEMPPADIAGHEIDHRLAVENARSGLYAPARLPDDLARGLLAHIAESVMVTDASGVIQYINAAFTRATGYPAEDVVGQTPTLLRSGLHPASYYAQMWQCLADEGSWQGEIWNRRKNGRVFPEWLHIMAIRDAAGQLTHYMSAALDLSHVKLSEERLYKLSYHDGLTGLANRLLFRDRLEHAMAQVGRHDTLVAVLMIDIDHFKDINDILGNETGDALLRQTAARLRRMTRSADTVARFGGDEFAILLVGCASYDAVATVAEKILALLAQPLVLDGQEVRITASMGISLCPRDGTTVQALLQYADVALHSTRLQGGGQYQFFTEALNSRLIERMMLQGNLRKALERNEFKLHYQPQVLLREQRIYGVEALLRWSHPELGSIPPLKFIPIAEDTGLIEPIGEWVLREACRQAVAWQQDGYPPVKMAVNISARQLRKRGFGKMIGRILKETGLAAQWLEIELTESMLMDHPESAVKILTELKEMGVSISLDDFGTGYSSLSYLNRFPIDTLKIDRAFVKDVKSRHDDAAIARAIIAMARSLCLKVVAEGVETSEQLEFLNDLDCYAMQGFLFSPPRSAEEVTTLFGKMGLAPETAADPRLGGAGRQHG